MAIALAMTHPQALLGRLFEQVHDVIVCKYFALVSGRAAHLDATWFVKQYGSSGKAALNAACRCLPKLCPGVTWAPLDCSPRSLIIIMVSDIGVFKWGWQSTSSLAIRGLRRSNIQIVELSVMLESAPDFLNREIALPPGCGITLDNILEKFFCVAYAEPFGANTQWGDDNSPRT